MEESDYVEGLVHTKHVGYEWFHELDLYGVELVGWSSWCGVPLGSLGAGTNDVSQADDQSTMFLPRSAHVSSYLISIPIGSFSIWLP
jgi:hypothetical protein